MGTEERQREKKNLCDSWKFKEAAVTPGECLALKRLSAKEASGARNLTINHNVAHHTRILWGGHLCYCNSIHLTGCTAASARMIEHLLLHFCEIWNVLNYPQWTFGSWTYQVFTHTRNHNGDESFWLHVCFWIRWLQRKYQQSSMTSNPVQSLSKDQMSWGPHSYVWWHYFINTIRSHTCMSVVFTV